MEPFEIVLENGDMDPFDVINLDNTSSGAYVLLIVKKDRRGWDYIYRCLPFKPSKNKLWNRIRILAIRIKMYLKLI